MEAEGVHPCLYGLEHEPISIFPKYGEVMMAGAMSAGTGGGMALHESLTARCSASEHGTRLRLRLLNVRPAVRRQ